MNSIKKNLIFNIAVIFIVLTIAISIVAGKSIYIMTMHTLEVTVQQSAQISAKNFTTQVDVFKMVLQEIPSHPAFIDSNKNKSEILNILSQKSEQYYCIVSFVDEKGYDFYNKKNVSDEEFFKRGMKGELFLSEVIQIDGQNVYTISMPAVVNGNTIGVIYMTPDYDYFNGLVNESAIGETGQSYIINNQGKVVLHNDINKVNTGYVSADNLGSDPDLKELVEIEQLAVLGENGFGVFKEGGVKKIAGFSPIANTDGWAYISTAELGEFTEELPKQIIITITVCALLAVFSIIIISRVSDKFINPIKQCVKRLSLLANGDLKSEVPQIKSKDEAGQLAASTEEITSQLNILIEDIQYILGEMSRGNFRVVSRHPESYIGDFETIIISIHIIINNMNKTLSNITLSSEEVYKGSVQVSNAAQTVSQGSTEQASSVQQLTDTLSFVSGQVTTSAQNSKYALELSKKTGAGVENGNVQMLELIKAIDHIAQASQKINNIIKVIEDIAFQTNILALNAAVEAARAGTAGKGFAVVADEVRSLASKSSENAKNTTKLINDTISAVKNGTSIASNTMKSLSSIIDDTKNTAKVIDEIAIAAVEQSENILKITANVGQINSVIQTTSAISQESAATSEELSAQAHNLKKLVSEFDLNL